MIYEKRSLILSLDGGQKTFDILAKNKYFLNPKYFPNKKCHPKLNRDGILSTQP